MKKYFPTVNQAFILVLQWVLLSFLAVLLTAPLMILAYFLKDTPVMEENTQSFAMLLMYVLSLYWIIKLAKRKIQEKDGLILDWRLDKVPVKLLIIAAVLTLASIVLIDPLVELIPMPETFKEMFKEMAKPNVFSFLMLVIAAPVLEELFFRGIVLEGFLKNYSPKKAIIWSAIIFGSAHLNPWQFIGAGLIGLFIGWVYYRTGSLIPGMLIHFVNNLTGFLIMTASKGETFSFYELFSDKWIYYGLLFTSLMIFVIGIFAINREYMYPVRKRPLPDKINLN